MNDNSKVLVDESSVPLDGDDTSNDDITITTPFDTSKIRVETKNTQMDALIKRIKNNEINLEPGFQRRAGIWTDKAQSRLIESMLIKIPLPAFYMDATNDDRWLVVDGLQRLTTIRRYVVSEELALTGMEFLTEYNGKKFSELPRSFQRRIEETDIVIYQIQPGTPADVKFDIFRRINTGGEPLSQQEIRHALNQGPVTEFLEKLANSVEFKIATDKGVSPKRMDDRECVLRFLAFTFFPSASYNNDNFDQFLNSAMFHANQLGAIKLREYEELFVKAMQTAHELFGKDAFRKRYDVSSARFQINKALFETWAVNLGKLDNKDREKLVSNRAQLINKFVEVMNKDKEFESSISQGTGSVRKIHYRFKKIAEIIQESLA
ncbi:MAG: DUF262 domain-containing protein [Methylobacter sp.]|uniref:DUF262 domain-containing protein n=1 Tax=Methylobacter sp. TaxID=2051955 RepID=UPI0025828816|nr:DUF262 domain-containing protein [Methylobacter sp.]MCL7421790.1 DUF262 domain-containing protein [Methylobacter sp.]